MKERARQLRLNATEAELRLWYHLRDRRLSGYKFRRQVTLGRYIVDFLCAAERLVIEIDGSQHVDAAGYDRHRTESLNRRGYRVLRYWNHDVLNRTGEVLENILRQLEHRQNRCGQ